MTPLSSDTILAAADEALRLIPPAWPLAATVAVNPFLGHAGESLAGAQNRLSRAAGLRLTMPRDFYAAKIASGEIADEDLAAAVVAVAGAPSSVEALKQAALAAAPGAPPAADRGESGVGRDGARPRGYRRRADRRLGRVLFRRGSGPLDGGPRRRIGGGRQRVDVLAELRLA